MNIDKLLLTLSRISFWSENVIALMHFIFNLKLLSLNHAPILHLIPGYVVRNVVFKMISISTISHSTAWIMFAGQKLKECWMTKEKSLKKVDQISSLWGNWSCGKLMAEFRVNWCSAFVSGPEPKPELKGDGRTFRMWLDTNQYQQDMAATVQGSEVIAEIVSCIVLYYLLLSSMAVRF